MTRQYPHGLTYQNTAMENKARKMGEAVWLSVDPSQ